MKRLLLCAVALTGCVLPNYQRGHVPLIRELYAQAQREGRSGDVAYYQGWIDEFERQDRVERVEQDRKTREAQARIDADVELVRIAQAQDAELRAFLSTLSQEQRFQWELQQGQLAALRADRELQQRLEAERLAHDKKKHDAEMRAVEMERRRKIWVGDNVNIHQDITVRHRP